MKAYYDKMCAKDRHAGIIGFKFKPSVDVRGKYVHVFNWWRDKKVRIIYMYRNGLDVLMSERKHKESDVPAHCQTTECTRQHLSIRFKLTIGNKLLSQLERFEKQRGAYLTMLHELGLEIFEVQLETFFVIGTLAQKTKAWLEVIKFLAPAKVKSVTNARVEHAIHLISSTSPDHQSQQVTNYDDVVKTLTGTRFQGLLH